MIAHFFKASLFTGAFSLLAVSGIGHAQSVQSGFNKSQCKNGLCTLMRIEVELDGNNVTPVLVAAKDKITSDSQTLTYTTVIQKKDKTCSKSILVIEPQFDVFATVFGTISGAAGNLPPRLSPTQEWIFMQYLWLSGKVDGIECTDSDFATLPTTPPQTGNTGGQTPGGGSTVPDPEPVCELQGIISFPNRKTVILNGNTHQLQDVVCGGWKIHAISDTSVKLKKAGQSKVLSIYR